MGEDRLKRYGHAACAWENLLLIVGGSRHYNKETRRRNCLNDVQTYSPTENRWTELNCDAGSMFEHRRYHSACIVGRHLLVYGGIDSVERYLSDTMALTLGRASGKELKYREFKWFKVGCKGDKPGKRAFHTVQLILSPERYRIPGQFDLFALPEVKGFRSRVRLNLTQE